MASSSSINTQEGNDFNDAPSVMLVPPAMPETWCPYFLTPSGPVKVNDSVMLNGVTVTATAVAARLWDVKESKKKVGDVKEENKRLKALVDSYADDLVIQPTEQNKTTVELQK
uniref:Uncharacterized protein n=1 Tax=Fagus sylvatica TaxID=28930 RepID=A0A2N9F4T0_FAGSY